MDANLLHISYEGNALEDPWVEAEASMWTRSVDPADAPNTPEYIEIEFEKGNPVGLNGKKLSPAVMLTSLNELGGKHGALLHLFAFCRSCAAIERNHRSTGSGSGDPSRSSYRSHFLGSWNVLECYRRF
jgi:hypothetical protein